MTNNKTMTVNDTLTNNYVFLNGADSSATDAVLTATKIENNKVFVARIGHAFMNWEKYLKDI